MPIDRRDFMKASGATAALAVTSLAGCSGFLGGGSSASNWQYDPATLADTQTRFFGSMQWGDLYSMREDLPPSMQSSFEMSGDSPIEPGDVDLFTGVGGGQVSMDTGNGAFFGSLAITGSFDSGELTDRIAAEGTAQEAGEYEGYTLYEGTNLDQGVPGGTVPGGSANATATVGISDSAMVMGVTVDQGSDVSVTGQDTVETMIDAEAGGAPRLTQNSDYAQTLQNELGGATMVAGGEVDGSLVEAYMQQAGGVGMGSQMVEGLRAGGFNADIGSSTTTYNIAAVYESSGAAESSGLADTIDGLSQMGNLPEGVDSVDATRNGDTVVVTVEGDTQTLLSQGQSQVPMGGAVGSAVPVDY